MLKNKLYAFIAISTIVFAQNIWTGNSVATSDDLDVFSLNPAGFGLDRGTQEGLYIPVNHDYFDIHLSNRYSNFGYLLKFSDNTVRCLTKSATVT